MNYWLILLGIVIYIALGMLWHGPIFGKIWMKAAGITPAKAKQMQKSMTGAYIGTVVAGAITATVIQMLLIPGGDIAGTLGVIALLWLGFTVPSQMSVSLWELRSWKLFWISIGYSLLTISIIAIVTVKLL